jgi:hypothetical protein
MFSPKTIVLLLLVSLLALYHNSLTTTILSITSNHTNQKDVLTGVFNTVPANRASNNVLARNRFEAAWKRVRSELLEYFDVKEMPLDAKEWYTRVSQSMYCAFLKITFTQIRHLIEPRL